jgi:hypothetical protein
MADISDLPDFGDPALLDHSTQGWKAVVVIVVCTTLVTIFVSLRTYTRKVIINELWVDDYLAIASNVSDGTIPVRVLTEHRLTSFRSYL